MRNKEVYTQILKLTSDKEWMNRPKTVKIVYNCFIMYTKVSFRVIINS
ncbi:hypothetical protein ECA02_33770 [Enterococcus casseliflavus]|nr:hypothetical protein ECA02_33770 [Enterococcus casseliflavus]